jgi:hypothetical protein
LKQLFPGKRLLKGFVQECREEKDRDQEEGVERKFEMDKEPFRFFHDFILSHRLPEEQKKIEKDKRRQKQKGLEFKSIGKIEKSEEKDGRARGHTEHQRPFRVSPERISVVAGTLLQKTEFREPFSDHQEITEGPPAQKDGEGWPDFRSRKCEPPDQKTNGVVGGFGYGVEKGDVL